MRLAKRRAPDVVALVVMLAVSCWRGRPALSGSIRPRASVNAACGLGGSRRLDGQRSGDVQTPDGYLWSGTEFGLVRFDGIDSSAWLAGGPTTPKPQDFVAASRARWHAVDRYVQWAGELEGWASDPLSRDYRGGIFAPGGLSGNDLARYKGKGLRDRQVDSTAVMI